MSYEIEYQRIVFVKDPELPLDDWDNKLYAFVEQGSSNCYEADTNRRSRSWSLIVAGAPYQIVREICSRAGYTEGGSLTLRGRRTSPESYLKLWRKCIANAVPVTELRQRTSITRARLVLHKEKPELKSWDQELLDELEADESWHRGKEHYGNPYLERSIEGAEGLDGWLQARTYVFVSHSYVL